MAAASTESGDRVFAGLATMVVVDVPDPGRRRGRCICTSGSERTLDDVGLFRVGWRISANAIDELVSGHGHGSSREGPQGGGPSAPSGLSVKRRLASEVYPGIHLAAWLRARIRSNISAVGCAGNTLRSMR